MDDSSPDLSLKLRRGSSDSRESFYMDFAQGIDSDIEEVTTIERIIPEHPGGLNEGDDDTLATPSGLEENKELPQCCYSIPPNNMSGGSHVSRGTMGGAESEISGISGFSGGSVPPLPSPASPGAALVSPETLSRNSSPAPAPPQQPGPQFPAPSCSSHRVHMESPIRYDGLVNREERLELLVNKADNLAASSVSYRGTARTLQRSLFWKNIKMYVILLAIVALAIYLVGAAACGGLAWKTCVR